MKILITVQSNDVAPRFDQAGEVIIAEINGQILVGKPRNIILRQRNAEELTNMIVQEAIDCVICGGIEDSFHMFFTWKKITVIDGIIGLYAEALQLCLEGRLHPGMILPSAKSAN